MSIFVEAQEIIRAVEADLVQENDCALPVIERAKRLIWLPTKFLRVGINEKLAGAVIWVLMTSLALLGASHIKALDIADPAVVDGITLSLIVAPLFLITFSMPSVYGHSGVSQSSVNFVVTHLHARHFRHVNEVELLQKSLKPFEERCRSRANALKWFVGLLWAGLIFVYSRAVEQQPTTHAENVSVVLGPALLLLLVAGAYICAWGYDAALDRLFRAIEFGCNDFCYSIDHLEKPPL